VHCTAEYIYGVKRIRDLVANTVVFWPSWQHKCELNLYARHITSIAVTERHVARHMPRLCGVNQNI
jgi:hypothetical protein